MPETNAALAIVTRDRKDDVRLSMALNKLKEEDPALRWGQDEMLHETLLKVVNDEHLAVTLDRLKLRYVCAVDSGQPGVASRVASPKSRAENPLVRAECDSTL